MFASVTLSTTAVASAVSAILKSIMQVEQVERSHL